MHNALSLNGAITNESQNAELVVLNMPLPPSSSDPGNVNFPWRPRPQLETFPYFRFFSK